MSLSAWYRASHNSRTRERIFFHKLYYDLKLAAARRGYPLTLFEPEVDRDAYDIILDDGDVQRRIQLKTVCKTAKTSRWDSTKRFMRLEPVFGDPIGIAPADCGVGGAFIIIVIDDTDDEGRVHYLYTDYYLIEALNLRLIREKRSRRALRSFGRPAKDRIDFAAAFLARLRQGNASDVITLVPKLFVRAKSPDALLGLLGLHTNATTEPIREMVMKAELEDFRLMVDGSVDPAVSIDARVAAESAANAILPLVQEPLLEAYSR